jgi:uncharacterized protein YjbJ (UPF0337 family)
MNTTGGNENWTEQKARLKRKFAVLTDKDLRFDSGLEEEMIGKLQLKLGKTKEELYRIISTL